MSQLYLPPPPPGAIREYLVRLGAGLTQWASKVHEKNKDVEIGAELAVVLTSPDGTRWKVTVTNAGALQVAAA